MGWATKYLDTYQSAQVKPPPVDATPVASIWFPPDLGIIKVNVDAAHIVSIGVLSIRIYSSG